ncbi:hypothetical protein COOONC_00615 [Cooperia oncophora]
MIPLAVNARLPVKNGIDDHKLLLHRIREIAKYEYVIMIGNGPDVSKVVPRFPNYVGGVSSYKGRFFPKMLELQIAMQG